MEDSPSEGDKYLAEKCRQAIEGMNQFRDSIAHADACRKDKTNALDIDVLTSVMEFNHLIEKMKRIIDNCEDDFISRWKKDPQACLEDLRRERAIRNMFFDFCMDFIKTQMVIPVENTSVKQLTDFIHFWIKEHFTRESDGRRVCKPEPQTSFEGLISRYQANRVRDSDASGQTDVPEKLEENMGNHE